MARTAIAILDLGFGDAGKGLLTDALTRRIDASAVVRWNGGAQAGHNVVTPDGRHHTFSQLGAGSFVAGVETWLGPEVIIHPTALLLEAKRLAEKGVPELLARVGIHAEAPVITPLHQALGRLRELARGDARHGSCGVGVGEVAAQLRSSGPVLRAAELADAVALADRLAVLRERAARDLAQLTLPRTPAVSRELAAFELASIQRWMEMTTETAARVRILDDESWRRAVSRHERVVFEGAQGVLLDRDHGFFPHTSPGDCTLRGARELAQTLGHSLTVVGVLRSYMVRHGAGPLPGELRPRPSWAREQHNTDGPWQGAVRVSLPDLPLLRYAIEHAGGNLDALAITHADRVEPAWGIVETHRYEDGAQLDRIPPFAPLSLEDRARETRRLAAATAVTRAVHLAHADPGRDLAEQLAALLGQRLALLARGPTCDDVLQLDAV